MSEFPSFGREPRACMAVPDILPRSPATRAGTSQRPVWKERFVKHFIFPLLAIAGLSATAAADETGTLRWHDNLNAGAARARQSGKPLFVVFRCVR